MHELSPHAYLLDGVEVDVDDFVEIFRDNFSDLFQFGEVVSLVWLHKHVQSDRCQVTHSHLKQVKTTT